MQKFLSLGAEGIKIQETADASQGFFHCACDFYFHLTCLHPYFYRLLMSFPLLAAALVTARAHISALEAEVKASIEAWESANAAKVSTEKAAKSAETRAKKAEKALADADQKRAKREQPIAERLDKISISVGSKCCIIPF
jgi:septal ring factor EnvC (AmiA/AmiB activator)